MPDKSFKFLGIEFMFTKLFDNIYQYTFGGNITTDEGTFNTETYWRKLCFGIYIRRESWL